ncbi:MAG: OmpH family outer membrane protein [Williamsia sp.]|nr:OmpH family outer membrane protein [Williamsia sp.]
MKYVKKTAAFILSTAALLFVQGQAKAQMKVGYISISEIITAMPEAKKADSSLTQYRDALVNNATEKQNVFNQDVQKFIQDSGKLTPAQREVKRTALQQQSQAMAGEEQRIQDELQKKQQELSAPIEKKATDAVQAVAKENGYTYVLPKEMVIVGPPGDDLMALVKKKLGIK